MRSCLRADYMISVLPVDNEKTLKQFVEFPYDLYRSNRYWVPPITREAVGMNQAVRSSCHSNLPAVEG